MKKNYGITLIALVVTIVVLLTLAGVSINMLAGDNGIIGQATKSKIETQKGRYIEEIRITASGEDINYKADEITFEQLIENVKQKIEEKDYVETVTEKNVTPYVVLEAQTDLNVVSVKFSKDSFEVIEGTVEPPKEADANIFNYVTDEEGNIEIIGFNFDKLTYDTVAGSIYGDGEITIKNLSILKIPETIDGKNVTTIRLDTHIISSGTKICIIHGIKEIIYPNTLKSLSYSSRLPDVEIITLNEGLEYLGEMSLGCFEKITSITIPASVKYVNDAFFGFNYYGTTSHLEINIEGKDSENDFESGYFPYCVLGIYSWSTFNINYLGK